jgi:hypothetical protein
LKRLCIVLALVCGATLTHAQTAPAQNAPASGTPPQSSPAKKELVAKVLQLQQPGIDNMATQIAQAPVLQMLQDARRVLQTQVPADQRDAIGKSIEADARKFVDEAVPLIRERATKLAPLTVGAVMEEKFSEDELKQVIAWMESPVNHKFQQLMPEMEQGLGQKLTAELAPALDPKIQKMEQAMRKRFEAAGVALPAASAAASANKK